MIAVRYVLHNILHTALENIAKLVDGIDFHVEILTKAVKLGAVYIMVRIQIVLGNPLLFHGCPKAIIPDHVQHLLIIVLTFPYYGAKINLGIVFI